VGGFAPAPCRFSTWLYRIAYNAFLNHQRRPAGGADGGEYAAPSATLAGEEQALLEGERAERLRRAVLDLPELGWWHCRFWGAVMSEIAHLEGLSEVVRKRLKRATILETPGAGREGETPSGCSSARPPEGLAERIVDEIPD
jgi:hypothetical protein